MADKDLSPRHKAFTTKTGVNYFKKRGKTQTDLYTDLSEARIATMLSQFKSLVTLCMAPEEDAATLEIQAARSLQIEMEWQALVKAAEDLLKLTRELKELWLAGPLRGIGEGEGDGDMAENAKKVQELVDGIQKKAREMSVGTNGQAI